MQNSSLYSNEQQLLKFSKTETEKQAKNLQELLFNDNDTKVLKSTALSTTPKKTLEMTKQLLFCNQLLSGVKNYQNNFEENCYKIKPDYLDVNVEEQEIFFKNNFFDNKLLAEQSGNCFDNLLIGKIFIYSI